MPYERRSAFGTQRGLVTDDEKMGQNQRQFDASSAAALAAIAAQERMHGKSDQTANRGLDMGLARDGTFGQRSAHDLTMDKGATERAFGMADRQMKPATMDAELRGRQYEDGAGVDRAINEKVLGFLNGMAPTEGQSQLDTLAALGALRSGKSMPDFQTQAAQRQITQMQLEDMGRDRAKGRALELRESGDVAGAQAAAKAANVPLPKVNAMDVASRDTVNTALDTAGREATKIGGQSYAFENFDAENPLPDDSQLPQLIEGAVQALVSQGVDPAEARAFVISKLREKYGQDEGGFSLPYVVQKGQSAVARYLAGLK